MRLPHATAFLALGLLFLLVPGGPTPVQALATVDPAETPVAWVVPNPLSAPALAAKLFVVDQVDGVTALRGYDEGGHIAWAKVTAGNAFAVGVSPDAHFEGHPPMLDGSRVYLRTDAGSLEARRQSDGVLLWSAAVGSLPIQFLKEAAPIEEQGRVFLWFAQGSVLRLRALQAADGAFLWDSQNSWPLGDVHGQVVVGSAGAYVTSQRADGGLWQLDPATGSGTQSWHTAGWYTSVPQVSTGQGSETNVRVAMANPGDAATPTRWLVADRRGDTGAAVWQREFSEATETACCDHIARPHRWGTALFVATQSSLVSLEASDGRIVFQTAAEGPVWSDFILSSELVRGPTATRPARLDSVHSETGERQFSMPLDLTSMPSGGALVGMLAGRLQVTQAVPERLLDMVPAGAIALYAWSDSQPDWDIVPGEPALVADPVARTVTFARVRTYNPSAVAIQWEAADGAWHHAGWVTDADWGGNGSRTWVVDAREARTYRAVGYDRLGHVTPPSNSVAIPAQPQGPTSSSSTQTLTASSSPTSSPASGGGGSPPATYTGAPTRGPSDSSGRTYTAAPGRLVVDTPTANATLSGDVVLRGRMVDPSLLGPPHNLAARAERAGEAWEIGTGEVGPDGGWSIPWPTTASRDGRLLPDGRYDIVVNGAGSEVRTQYRLDNGNWVRTEHANVTFEDAADGSVWVNATWEGSSGFPPAKAWVVVSDGIDVTRFEVVAAPVPGQDGHYLFSIARAVQQREGLPLDVSVEFEQAGGGTVSEALARQPAAGTSVSYHRRDTPSWAAPAAGIAATGMVAVAAVGMTEVGRFWALRLLPIPLFSRLSGNKVLENRRREQLVALVEGRPGIAMKDLAELSGVHGGSLSHHLATLEREGLVRRQRIGLRMTFLPAAGADVARQLPALQASLLRLAAARPMTQSDAARELAVSRQSLHYHVGQLRDSGLLDVQRDGRTTVLRVPATARARMWSCAGCQSLLVGTRGPRTRCQACGAPQGPPSAA